MRSLLARRPIRARIGKGEGTEWKTGRERQRETEREETNRLLPRLIFHVVLIAVLLFKAMVKVCQLFSLAHTLHFLYREASINNTT